MSAEEHPSAAVEQATSIRLEEHGPDVEHGLPHESLRPITLAAGVALLAFGLLTSLVFSGVGILLVVWALGGWIEELRHGH